MFLTVALALCLLSVLLCGGRLSALGELRLRHTTLIGTALAAQVVIISIVPSGSAWVHQAVHLSTYGLAGAFIWVNRRVPGIVIGGLGGLANFAAIVANGGVMPASESALRTAGISSAGESFRNSAAVPDAHLQVLGDIFALPASWPVHNVFSIGDVVLVGGLLVGLHMICDSYPARRLRARSLTVLPAAPKAS